MTVCSKCRIDFGSVDRLTEHINSGHKKVVFEEDKPKPKPQPKMMINPLLPQKDDEK